MTILEVLTSFVIGYAIGWTIGWAREQWIKRRLSLLRIKNEQQTKLPR